MNARFGWLAITAGMVLLSAGCATAPAPVPTAGPVPASDDVVTRAQAEIEAHYAKASPEVREYILWTARTFGRGGLWLPEDSFADVPPARREERIVYLARLLDEAEYGRHLCQALAEAGALRDDRLVPGLLKVAGYHRTDVDYDCRPKWMAVAALARQESDAAVPLLVGLVDHGNQNTRMWARAALSRTTGQGFDGDKEAWARWCRSRENPVQNAAAPPAP